MTGSEERSERGALDRERVVRVALELLDEVGLDDLSMRRLAERLGVTAASLYWYVRDKSELLDLLADAMSAELPFDRDVSGLSWRAQLEAAYNWNFVSEDKSRGIHNTAYAVGLLKASIADLKK